MSFYFHSFSGGFSYGINCLREGLDELGVRNIGCENSEEPVSLLIIDVQNNDITPYKPLSLNVRTDHSTVIFSMADRVNLLHTKDNLPIIATHENKFCRFQQPRIPWAFGLSNRIIEESEKRRGRIRENTVLRNFRPSYNQSVRDVLDLVLLPHLKRHTRIDKNITSNQDNHFDKLSSYVGCLAYGGNFFRSYAEHPALKNDFDKHVTFLKEPVIIRWDSWRFWESLTMGCLTFHLDFDKYGFLLPVMPENWKHYIGLNLEDIKADVERLMDERDRIPEIAEAGRQWAIENYSPVATARRFLSMFK